MTTTVPDWLVWTPGATAEFFNEQEARAMADRIGGIVFHKSEERNMLDRREIAKLCEHFSPTTLAGIIADLEGSSDVNAPRVTSQAEKALIANVGEAEAEELIGKAKV